MKYKKTLAVVISLVASYFAAYPVGHWYARHGGAEYGWVYFGPFPGYSGAFLFSYVFLTPIILSLMSDRFKHGFFAIMPLLILGLFDIQDDWSRLLFLFSAAGLGLAWVILFIRSKTHPKQNNSSPKVGEVR